MNLEHTLEYVRDAVNTYAPEIEEKYYVDTSEYDFEYGNLEGVITYSIVRASGAKSVIEFGTRFGGSAVFLSLATMRNGGEFSTVEAWPDIIAKAKRNLDSLGLTANFILSDMYELNLSDLPYYDIIFYDAAHDPKSSEWLIRNLMPMKPLWFIMHDIFCDSRENGGRKEMFEAFPENEKMVSVPTIASRFDFRPPEKHGFACQNSTAYIPLLSRLQ